MITIIILVGGKGTRIEAISKGLPKCLMPIGNKPILQLILDRCLAIEGVEIILSTGFRADKVDRYLSESQASFSGDIKTLFDSKQLGTFRAAEQCIHHSKFNTVLILNGDTLINVSINDFVQSFFSSGKSKGCVCFKSKDSRYGRLKQLGLSCGQLEIDADLANAGVYIFQKNSFVNTEYESPDSLEEFFYDGNLEEYFLYTIDESDFVDIGVVRDFELAQDLGWIKHDY